MAIVNIRDMMSRGISSVGARVKNVGRSLSENPRRFTNMIGVNINRRNLAIGATGVGAAIGGAILLTRYSGWSGDNDQGTGIIGNAINNSRFGKLFSNLGYNRIDTLKKQQD